MLKCIYERNELVNISTTFAVSLWHRMEYYKLTLLVVFLFNIEHCWSSDCVVDSFTVKQDFDPKKVSPQIKVIRMGTKLFWKSVI